MEVNKKLKELRKDNNFTIKEVSNALGINISTYSNYEQGLREPPLDLIKKICVFYNVSANYLFDISVEE